MKDMRLVSSAYMYIREQTKHGKENWGKKGQTDNFSFNYHSAAKLQFLLYNNYDNLENVM